LALPYLFGFWAHAHQLPPAGDWRCWLILGGRGAGKTRAGAEWVRAQVEGPRPRDPGRCRRLALVAETLDQAREVMVFGESGILASSPPDRRPDWIATRRMLAWPNGATAQVFSAHEPESLRGPQFDAAWVDELAKWPKAQEAWDMLQFTLRLGDHPRVVATTTPRNVPLMKELMARDDVARTQAPTEANRVGLASSFLDEVRARYAGQRLERQELDGELLEDVDGALWTSELLDDCRLRGPMPEFDRIVVAIDPAAKGRAESDECGIVVVGASLKGPPWDWRAVVLEDASVAEVSPTEWAQTAVAALERHGATRIIAEVNQGGDMVESTLRTVAPLVPYRAVTATKGKAMRAEPVAALYEQGRVAHIRGLTRLEAQMCQMTPAGFCGPGSPDRLDALVWALTDLMIGPAGDWVKRGEVRIRSL
jgi:phage terminase large subunit-like protein